MSHMPRRLRQPRAVTVLIWKGPGSLPPASAQTVQQMYRRGATRGLIVASGDWDIREVSRRFGGVQ